MTSKEFMIQFKEMYKEVNISDRTEIFNALVSILKEYDGLYTQDEFEELEDKINELEN